MVLLCIPVRIMTSTATLHSAARRSGRYCTVDQIVNTDLLLSAWHTVFKIITKVVAIVEMRS